MLASSCLLVCPHGNRRPLNAFLWNSTLEYSSNVCWENSSFINPLNAKLNLICHLLALLDHHILHVSRIRVKNLTRILSTLHEDLYTFTITLGTLHEDLYTFTIILGTLHEDLYMFTIILGTLHEDLCTFTIISHRIFLRTRNISDKLCREGQNTHFIFHNFFSKIVPFMRDRGKIC
jgi:hypothetical protein